MHIPDGVLSPDVCLGAGAVSAAAVGYSLHKIRQDANERIIPLTGMMAAVIFAGQMVNFPISILGIPAVSGHLMGGVLAAALLGPWGGCVALFLVLLVQCVLFADGGLMSLGANTLNMAVIGSWGGYALISVIRERFSNRIRGEIVAVVVASWLSVLASATVFCGELWLSWRLPEFDFGALFSLMITVHSAIGVGEALMTGMLVSFLLAHRPELVLKVDTTPETKAEIGPVLAAGAVLALVVCAFLAPFASGHPDGLEYVAEQTSLDQKVEENPGLILAGYSIPLPVADWKNVPAWQFLSVGLSGILGVMAVAGICAVLGRGLAAFPASGNAHGG